MQCLLYHYIAVHSRVTPGQFSSWLYTNLHSSTELLTEISFLGRACLQMAAIRCQCHNATDGIGLKALQHWRVCSFSVFYKPQNDRSLKSDLISYACRMLGMHNWKIWVENCFKVLWMFILCYKKLWNMNDKNCTVFDKNWTTGMLMLFLIKQTFWPSLYLYDINLII